MVEYQIYFNFIKKQKYMKPSNSQQLPIEDILNNSSLLLKTKLRESSGDLYELLMVAIILIICIKI
jgi:hypothetical protein